MYTNITIEITTLILFMMISFIFLNKINKTSSSSIKNIDNRDNINNQLKLNLSINILTKIVYLLKYLGEQTQFVITENETLNLNIKKLEQMKINSY